MADIDIVKRLRGVHEWIAVPLCSEAAAEIEQLRADKAAISATASGYLHEIELLRSALPVWEWDY